MHQDQIKQILLRLKKPKEDFTVIFSGKSSKRANGIYYPEKREIIIHNRNFSNDNNLIYTAIHEYAHHIHNMESPLPISNRSHTNKYWSIFHKLLFRAEQLEIYKNIYENSEEFIVLTQRIRSDYLTKNGELIRSFGKVLVEAQELCRKHDVSFADYLDRVLRIPRDSAKTIMKTHLLEVEPEVGYDNMRTLVSITDRQQRLQAQNALIQGETPAMIKDRFKSKKHAEDEIDVLVAEKNTIERRIQQLTEKLRVIENRIRDAEYRTVQAT